MNVRMSAFEVLILNQFSKQGCNPSVAKLIFLSIIIMVVVSLLVGADKLSDVVVEDFLVFSRLV